METVVRTKQDILAVISENHARIRALGVKRLGLFGSFLHGEQRSDSDVDFVVEFQPGRKTFDNFMELTFLLEGLLQRRVELVTTEALSPYIGPHILEEVEYAALPSLLPARIA